MAKIPWSQRVESLAQTWCRRKPRGMLIGSTIGWRPDPIHKQDGRMHARRNGMPDEYARRLPHKRKIDAWSK